MIRPDINWLIVAAGLLGFSAIALGAYGDHGLRGTIDESAMHSFETALRYQLFHAITLLALGFGSAASLHNRLRWAGTVMLIGTLIFCGSIYASVMLGMPSITMLTPFGGITLMASWLILVWAGFEKTVQT